MTALPISYEGVSRSFSGVPVLQDLDATFPAGRISVVLGTSGAGKTVLLRLALGLLAPDAGRLLIGDHDLGRLSWRALARLRRSFGVAFQGGALFTSMSAAENVAMPLEERRTYSRRAIHERVDELLHLVGLPDAGDLRVDQLSGGMVKRIALARAVATRPRVVFLDEPSSGLDPVMAAHIDAVIQRLHAATSATFLVISHDIASARTIAHHAGLLHEGRLRAFGGRDAFFASTDPVIRQFLERRTDGPLCNTEVPAEVLPDPRGSA